MADTATPVPFTEALQPAAAPVDTYVRPAQPPQSNLFDLAKSLQHLDVGLQDWFQQQAGKQNQEDAIKAQADFYNNNQQGFADAVASGKIPASASPAYVAAYKKQQGAVAGYDLAQQAYAAYDVWPGKTSSNPADFQNFVRSFVANNVNSQDPDVLAGMVPHINGIVNGLYARYTQDRHEQVYNGLINTTAARAAQIIDQADLLGISPQINPEPGGTDAAPPGVNYPQAFQQILDQRQAAINAGAKPEDLDKQINLAIAQKALALHDFHYLDWFNQGVPDKDYTFGDAPGGLELKDKTTHQLIELAHQQLVQGQGQQKKHDEAMKNAVIANIQGQLAHDPNAVIDEGTLQLASRYDPMIRTNIVTWRKAISEGNEFVDRQAVDTVTNQILTSGDPMGAFSRGMSAGVLKGNAAPSAWDLAQKVQKAGGAYSSILTSDYSKKVEGAILSEAGTADATNPMSVKGENQQTLSATYDYHRMLLDWAIANPNANPIERDEAAAKIGKLVVGGITRSATGGATYAAQTPTNPFSGYTPPLGVGTPPQTPGPAVTAPPGVPTLVPPGAPTAAPNAAAPNAAPGPTGMLPPSGVYANPRPQGVPAGARFMGGAWEVGDGSRWLPTGEQIPSRAEVNSWVTSSFTPEQQQTLKASAADAAVSTGEAPDTELARYFLFMNHTWQPGGGNAAPVAPRAQPRASLDGNIVPASFEGGPMANLDDHSANSILDNIRGLEASGNYNAVYGNSRASTDLSGYTLNQVMAMQRQRQRAGASSTAVGGYQFLLGTLRDLVKSMGLTGEEKFTPKLQDEMALTLMKQKGYDDWRAGKVSTEEFAKELSKVWASLPDPTTGQSYYAGDGLNSALQSVGDFVGNLATAKTLSI